MKSHIRAFLPVRSSLLAANCTSAASQIPIVHAEVLMRRHVKSFGLFLFVSCLLLFVPLVRATIFGNIRGIVHDPQHRPIGGVGVTLKSTTSAWTQTAQTEPDGSFSFSAVPLGDYMVTVTKSGFASESATVTLNSDSSPILHFQLKIATVNQTAT